MKFQCSVLVRRQDGRFPNSVGGKVGVDAIVFAVSEKCANDKKEQGQAYFGQELIARRLL